MSLREVLGVHQDANLFAGAPCTDLSRRLWDPQGEWEPFQVARERHREAAQLCHSQCAALEACSARRDRLAAAKRPTHGVWAGMVPGPRGRPTGGCGTTAGYHAHRRAGEVPCDLCVEAHRVYMRAYMAGRRQV